MEKDNSELMGLFNQIGIIKPCPFCGSPARYLEFDVCYGREGHTVGQIRCANEHYCGCSTPEIDLSGFYGATTTKNDVYRIWNARTKGDSND